MKKILLLFAAMWCVITSSMAQNFDAEKNAALQLVSAHRTALGLSADDLNNLVVSNAYVDKSIGVRYVYLQQTFKDIPVYNQIQVIAFKGDKAMSNAGGRIADIDKKVNVISGIPSNTAESAVMAALADKRLNPTETIVALSTKDNGRKVEFGKLGVARENITAQLMWVPSEDGSSLRLAWQVYFIPTTTSDYWLVKVDANNNNILGSDNLTVYCNWDDPKHIFQFGSNHNHLNDLPKADAKWGNLFDFKTFAKRNTEMVNSPSLADNADYRVIPLPYEAPSFMPGAPSSATVNNPWTAAQANAWTLKWHSTDASGTDYNYTRGNNVWAVQDRAANNSASQANSATSTTPLPNLTFTAVPNYGATPISGANEQFNITNLFYFNNILHDVLWAYGFDEPGGNFQFNNLGRGGLGNDHVWGDAQDGSGTNNANFSTPADGGSGRMQMFLWSGSPQIDGDADNGVIAHEFGHGLSNRLIGGPNNVSCVGNGEHQGEGISDWNALMFTQDWAASNVNSGLVGRGIGTYVLNQPTTGVGIRSQKYTTDFAVNNHVYLAVLPGAGQQHARGEYWAEAAWEATWAIIQQAGTISPTIYYNGSNGSFGNIAAMRIGVQAMKLIPCGSGFIDHRNGWLAADTLLYGGQFSCAIWEAFRKRGMGAFADQGSANSAADQTPDFTAWSQVRITGSGPSVPEGTNFTFTNTVTTCSRAAISGYLLTDTLPLNANFVSATNGGTYNAGNRVVSWPVSLAAQGSATYQVTVNVPLGSFPGNVVMRSSLFNDGVPSLKRFNVHQISVPITQVAAGCPVISLQPTAVTTCINTSVSYSVSASAANPISYQWQVSTAGVGGPYTNLTNVAPYSNVTTATMTINPTAIGMNGYYYRCQMVTSDCPLPGTISNPALLTVVAASVGGTVNPPASQVCGTTNSGTLTLSGHTGNVIRWEFSTVGAGGPWTPIANTTTTHTYNNLTQTTWFQAVVQAAGCATATSSVAVVNFVAANAMSIQSDAGTVLCQGDPARLTAVDGGGVISFTSAGGLTIPSSGTASPYPLPLVVSGLPAGATVQSVKITNLNHTWTGDIDVAITGPTFVAGGSIQAVMLLSDLGNDANDDAVNTTITFVDGAPRVPNQNPIPSGTYSCTNDGAVNDVMPAPGPNLNVAAPLLTALNTATMNGTWNLWVNDQVGGDAGNIASYTINFTTPTAPITTGTFLWSPATGLNSTTTNPVAASPAVTTTYTVLHNNGAGCIRQASITLTVNTRPGVSTQPVNTTVCAGSAATFTAVATGTGATYQWQQSTNGGVTWVDLTNTAPYSGVNTGTLTINPVTVAMNGYRYRLAVSGTCPPVANSNGAILTVNALPVVTINPAGPTCGGVAGTNGTALTASGATTYTWAPLTGLYTNATATTAYPGGNANPVYAAPTVFTTYTVSGTDAGTGCVGTASVIVNYTPPPPTVTPNPVVMCLGDPAVKLKSSTSQSYTASFSSGNINLNIPDGPTIPPVPSSYPAVSNNITASGIPAGATITNVRVKFNVTHAYVSDLVIALKAPNGQIINLCALANYANPAGANFVNTTFNSASSTTLAPPYTAAAGYKADLAGATFVAFGFTFPGGPTGYIPTANNWGALYSTPNGVWSVGLYDAGAPDGGTWNNWSLDIDYVVGVPARPAVWSPIGGLFSDANATIPYVANTPVDSVWTRPTPAGVYNYNVTVQSLPTPPAAVTTPMTGGNGNNMVFFNLTNTNGYAMTLTGISTNAFNSGTATAVNMYYKTSAIAGNPGLINAGNGWNIAPGATATNVAVTGNVLNPVLSAINLTIPAGATYGIGLEFTGAATFPAYTNGDGTIDNYTNNGVTISVDGNIGWGGPVAPGPPANNPRNFNGAVYLTAGNVPPCTSPARVVTVTVNTQPTVTIQPVNQTICTDKVATFTVAATIPLGAIAYQWEVSTNNGNTYTAITNGGVYSGATTPTLTITAPPVSMSGYFYRCRLQGPAPCTPAYSFFRILTVNPLPTVVISASPYVKLFPGLRTTLSSTVTPFAAAQYVWRRDGVIVPGATTGTWAVDVDGLGEYQLTVTDVNGCVNSSNKLTISDSISTNCFLYPNPSSGRFQVRYHSVPNNSVLPRTVTVYDGKGARILTQVFGITVPYARMDIDLRPYGKGVYWVEIGDRNGSRIAICRAVIE